MLRCLCVGLVMAVSASSAWAGVVDRIVAVVDEEVITLSEVYDLGDQFIQQRCSRTGGVSITTCMLSLIHI